MGTRRRGDKRECNAGPARNFVHTSLEPLNDADRRLHEQNKREAFDAMRAYHQSEIAHKAHTVEVIKTLLTLVVSSYGGLIALTLGGKLASPYVGGAAAVLLLGVSVIVLSVVRRTNQKIDTDHTAYEAHRSEYLAERSLLRVDEAFAGIGYETHWRQRSAGHRSGDFYTRRLVIALGCIVVMAAVFGTLLSVFASAV